MSILANLKSTGMEEQGDSLGGFSHLESDIYEATVKAAYLGESKNGAVSVDLIAAVNDSEYRETFYITNRNKENFYTRDKKKYPRPGFTQVNDICKLAIEKDLSELEPEEKVVNVYNYEERKQVPTPVQMLTELIGSKVKLAILKQEENKNVKVADGSYVPSDETRTVNVIDKVFHADTNQTASEVAKEQDAAFHDAWLNKNKGVTRNKVKPADPRAANAASGTKATTATKKPSKSLFD